LRDALRIFRWRGLYRGGHPIRVRQMPAYRRFVAAMTEFANRHYRPSRYPGTITLMLTKDTKYRVKDRRRLISAFAQQTHTHIISGTRTGLFLRPQVEELAAQLQSCLDQADREWAEENNAEPARRPVLA
jgi:hypothetical protein